MARRARLAVAVEWVVVDDAMGERTVVACSVRFALGVDVWLCGWVLRGCGCMGVVLFAGVT